MLTIRSLTKVYKFLQHPSQLQPRLMLMSEPRIVQLKKAVKLGSDLHEGERRHQ